MLLGSESGRAMLETTRTVIVDEIHARGRQQARLAILLLSLERLASCAAGLSRIGLSATQKPIETVARFLVGVGNATRFAARSARIIDTGHRRGARPGDRSARLAARSRHVGGSLEQIYDRLAELIQAHRTTLVFVNTRRLAERITRQLSDRLGRTMWLPTTAA